MSIRFRDIRDTMYGGSSINYVSPTVYGYMKTDTACLLLQWMWILRDS